MEGMHDLAGEPFVAAYLAPAMTAAYDELIGPGRWQRSVSPADLGETVVVRFPAEEGPGHRQGPSVVGNMTIGERADA